MLLAGKAHSINLSVCAAPWAVRGKPELTSAASPRQTLCSLKFLRQLLVISSLIYCCHPAPVVVEHRMFQEGDLFPAGRGAYGVEGTTRCINYFPHRKFQMNFLVGHPCTRECLTIGSVIRRNYTVRHDTRCASGHQRLRQGSTQKIRVPHGVYGNLHISSARKPQ